MTNVVKSTGDAVRNAAAGTPKRLSATRGTLAVVGVAILTQPEFREVIEQTVNVIGAPEAVADLVMRVAGLVAVGAALWMRSSSVPSGNGDAARP